MFNILCCILDSRGNSHQNLINSVIKTCNYARVSIYSSNQEKPTVERYNEAYQLFKHKHDTAVMFGASDIEILTKDFDKIACDFFENNEDINIIYPDDGIQHEKLPTHPIFRQSFIEKIGEFFPSGYMYHQYVDNYIFDLGKALNCIKYMPTLKLRHNHPINYRAKWDEHYLKAYNEQNKQHDLTMYEKCISEHLPVIIDRYRKS